MVSPQSIHYGGFDRERFVPEQHSSDRGDFQRDRGRIIHSSGFRKLAQKTQVLSPTSGVDFARNRLTHSLEVAQVGREIGASLGLDPDVVDAACLAHDLGHPPFGHNGEVALAQWATECGGFEGNAQTFRALTRLEPKVFGPDQSARGLNLTRASLDAASKYPWFIEQAVTEGDSREKFGVYEADREIFTWLRGGIPDGEVSIEAQVMDLSDDVAYSVHDFEDAIVGAYLDPKVLSSPSGKAEVISSSVGWAGESLDPSAIEVAYDRLMGLDTWPQRFDGSREDLASLKNFTSSAIGRFARSVSLRPRPESSALPDRYRVSLDVPPSTRAEIALLKGIVATSVMRHETRQPIYQRQRQLLTELLDWFWATGEEHLEPSFREDFLASENDQDRQRVIVDQVASLTDQAAIYLHDQVARL